jgi:chorismate mutase
MKFFVFCLLTAQALFSKEATMSDFYEEAKEKCHDMAAIRVEMDRINSEILQKLAERTAYVLRAGDLKSKTTKIADDRQRVSDQEKKIIEKSIELGIPTEISVPAFRAIVENSILFQQEHINRLVEKGR